MRNMENAERLVKAIKSAAEKMPEDWMVSIDMEGGYAGVSLVDPSGDVIDSNEFMSPDDTIAEQLENAIAFAISIDSQQ